MASLKERLSQAEDKRDAMIAKLRILEMECADLRSGIAGFDMAMEVMKGTEEPAAPEKPKRAAPGSVEKAVLARLDELSSSLTEERLLELTGHNVGSIRSVLRKLKRLSVVEEVTKGEWIKHRQDAAD